MSKKVVVVMVLSAVFGLGVFALGGPIVFPVPPDDCSIALCAPCPEGSVPSPTDEDCCACVPLAEF